MERSERTVVIAHRDALMGTALQGLLESMEFDVLSTVSEAKELRDALSGKRTSLILVDAGLPGLTPESVTNLKAVAPVAVIGHLEEGDPFLRAGAVGLLSSDLDEDHFRKSLELLLEGDVVVSGNLAPGGVSVTASEAAQQEEHLSEREREVLSLVSKGATNREIAEQIIVTEHTVKVHLRHILEKLNLRNRQQAAAYAVQNGLVIVEEAEEAAERPGL